MKVFVFLFLLATLLFSIARECTGSNAHNKDPIIESVCANNAKRHLSQIQADRDSWIGLPWNRSDLIKFADKGFDTDGDGAISVQECENARNFYFTALQLQFGETCETVFKHCDCDQDGFITAEDFLLSEMTCLKNGNSGKIIWALIGSKITNDGAFKGKNEEEDLLDVPVEDWAQTKED